MRRGGMKRTKLQNSGFSGEKVPELPFFGFFGFAENVTLDHSSYSGGLIVAEYVPGVRFSVWRACLGLVL